MSAYKKETIYTFIVDDIQYAIIDWIEAGGVVDTIALEETRKNGQEDCHMEATVMLYGNEWRYYGESISDQEGRKRAANVLKYINSNKFNPE